MHIRIVSSPISLSDLATRVSAPENGALSIFLGTVRNSNDGHEVTGIEYSAYTEMAELELRAIATEASMSFATNHIVIEHRVGTLTIGETSVAVLAGHQRRRQAQDCVAFVVEELKRRVPIWKLEHYADGRREWVGSGNLGLEAPV